MSNIRNFAIIAHVDHGKSTLADRLLEFTGTVEKGKHCDQMLDKNPISRERGITIKLAPVRMQFKLPTINNQSSINNQFPSIANEKLFNIKNGNLNISDSEYILNLIDTPGHVDFSYEVERTLSCVEGAILLVDASKGIQAQTVAHCYKAIEQGLKIIPVINKIDLTNAEVEKTVSSLADFLGIDNDAILKISAKTGEGVEKVLCAICNEIPPPDDKLSHDIKTLIFDSYYDPYKGVIAFIRLFSESIRSDNKLYLLSTNTPFNAKEVGIFTPDLVKKEVLQCGEIGYVVTNLKDIGLVPVGDTISDNKESTALPGYKKVKPMVYISAFPSDQNNYQKLKIALQKLQLNDSSVAVESITSNSLGPGVKLGFLGLLHADVIKERLKREFDSDVIYTPAQTEYKKILKSSKTIYMEPFCRVMIISDNKYYGNIVDIVNEFRGEFLHMENKQDTLILTYIMPIAELIRGFFDRLKSVTSGFGSLDWEYLEYRQSDVNLVEILINDEIVEELSYYICEQKSRLSAISLLYKLKKVIQRQQFEVKIQAKFKGKIIASIRISPLSKDVTAKLYGGDRTRKMKLLSKQKAGKKKLKHSGVVALSKEALANIYTLNTEV